MHFIVENFQKQREIKAILIKNTGTG